MKIVISGVAEAFDRKTGKSVGDPEQLSQLSGLAYAEDSCGEYLSESLYEVGVIGGKIELSYQAIDSGLRVVTTFHAPQKLKKAELQLLVGETAAQWSDGIGEGEFQHAEELGIDVNISLHSGDPTVEQIDDGVVIRKPRKSELLKLLQNRRVDEEAAIALVKSGAALDAKDRDGRTALHLACQAVLPNLVELLLRRGALKTPKEASRILSALAFCYGPEAVLENSAQIARWLVDNGADVNNLDGSGRTPLMMAASRNNMPLVKFLLSKGPDINAQEADEHNQKSVLMFANRPEMLKLLLKEGADPHIRTAYGEDAYEVQLRNSHQENFQEMAEIIKEHMQ